MKYIAKPAILGIILLVFFAKQSSGNSVDPLNFMMKCNLPKAKAYAKQEHKPIMLYIHSSKCISSRTFTRQVVANLDFAKWADKNFVCMEANITTKGGEYIAKKYNIMSVPAIVLVSFDEDLNYTVEMKLDSVSLYNQFRSFVTANCLKSQIEMLHHTNGLSYEDASIAIAKSYAKHDFKNHPSASAKVMAAEMTLNIKGLKFLYKAYIIEFKKLAQYK